VRPRLDRVISGGQTGADQAGLEVAARLGIPTGGVMPEGFHTEDGPRSDLAACYGLVEAGAPAYPERTERNVLLAEGTVVFVAESSYQRPRFPTGSACETFPPPRNAG
jgi:predicted Rossmann-fold nucleotide-binding protein